MTELWNPLADQPPTIVAEVRPQPASTDQPTNPKALTPKMQSVGIGGFSSATLITWLKARFDLDITVEDVAVLLPVVTLVAGYFTKELRERFKK